MLSTASDRAYVLGVLLVMVVLLAAVQLVSFKPVNADTALRNQPSITQTTRISLRPVRAIGP